MTSSTGRPAQERPLKHFSAIPGSTRAAAEIFPVFFDISPPDVPFSVSAWAPPGCGSSPEASKCSENEMSDIRLNKIGFVFQSFHLLPRQSAISNVEMPLNYAHVPKKERRERAFAALDRVGLADRVDFRPNQLSGGQMQRVAIARAIVNNPRLLLADEPTGALDSKSGRQVMELFQKLNDEGVSVLMITHDPDIAAHAKRVVMIRDGELQEKR